MSPRMRFSREEKQMGARKGPVHSRTSSAPPRHQRRVGLCARVEVLLPRSLGRPGGVTGADRAPVGQMALGSGSRVVGMGWRTRAGRWETCAGPSGSRTMEGLEAGGDRTEAGDTSGW